MKMLVATAETQGDRDGDCCWGVEGELVYLSLDCDDPHCGCSRGFAGLASSKATTTCVVADIPSPPAEIRQAFLEALIRSGWIAPGHPEDPIVEETFSEAAELASAFPVGTVLGRAGDQLLVRRLTPAA